MTGFVIDGEGFEVTAASIRGRRDENQDSYAWVAVTSGRLVGETPSGPLDLEAPGRPDMLLALVCDGLGGLVDGAAASSFVAGSLAGWAEGCSGEDPVGSLLGSLPGIEEGLMARHPGSGTTLSAVIGTGAGWTSIHLGDSRCYRISGRDVTRSRDHSPVEDLVRRGVLSEEGMNSHPMSHLLDRCMGNDDAASAEVADLGTGWDRLALCTDGAFGYMSPSDFADLVRTAPDAASMLDGAYLRGSMDNITILTIDRVRPPGSRTADVPAYPVTIPDAGDRGMILHHPGRD